MVRGSSSRMIFVDSSVNTHHDRTKISLPPHPFSAVGAERVAFSLQQFSIRRNWFNINPTNNTGYVYIDATYHEFVITPGVYSTFVALATAIQTALNEAAATIVVRSLPPLAAGARVWPALDVSIKQGFLGVN